MYNKLVRDKIPDIIKNNGEEPIIKVLSYDEFKIELEKKKLTDIIDTCDKKREKYGGFQERLYLSDVKGK